MMEKNSRDSSVSRLYNWVLRLILGNLGFTSFWALMFFLLFFRARSLAASLALGITYTRCSWRGAHACDACRPGTKSSFPSSSELGHKLLCPPLCCCRWCQRWRRRHWPPAHTAWLSWGSLLPGLLPWRMGSRLRSSSEQHLGKSRITVGN